MAGFHRLRVAFVAPPWYPVPPLGYGGIERVVYLLAQALARRGHDVTVFGRPGLADDVKVVTLAEPEWQTELGGYGERHRLATFLTRVHMQLRTRRFDVVHDHNQSTGLAMAIAAQLPCPVVTTIHGRLEEAEIDFFKETGTESALVAISRAQRSQAPDLPWSAVVHNAVPADELIASANKQDYLVQLARIAPDKGQHLSIQIAREVGLPLVLAGKISEGEGSYFEGRIQPHLGERVTWLPEVAGAEKAWLLARARAMLFPIQWEEPFGMAVVEAMASGTPVLAMARGAMPEIIDAGQTGLLGNSVEELIELFPRLAEIDPHMCAQVSRRRFSAAAMAARYERVYEQALLACHIPAGSRVPSS